MSSLAATFREVLVPVALILGLVIGSFLNVVIHRLPRGASLSHPGSHCTACGAPVRWFDNVPLLSWLVLQGRCRSCAAPISWRYPAVELATGLLFAAIAWRHGWQPMTPVWCAFGAALLASAVIDFDHQIIPDEISLGGLVLALILVPFVQIAAGASWVQACVQRRRRRSRRRPVLARRLHARARVDCARRQFEHWPGRASRSRRSARATTGCGSRAWASAT
jgi:hypothetical protein